MKDLKKDLEWEAFKKTHYKTNTVFQWSDYGSIDFSEKFAKGIVGGENLTYDECLDLQKESKGKMRSGFQTIYYNIPSSFKGQIEKKKDGRVCFKRIYIEGMYPDNLDFFESREDHVWMDEKGFEEYNVGDSLEFFAKVYRYIKTSNGKQLDFGLRNPSDVKKIESYKLPSDEDLRRQAVNSIICESCYLYDTCDRVLCTRNKKEISDVKKSMLNILRNTSKVQV